jgi:RND family efflux transporter MFP subunit
MNIALGVSLTMCLAGGASCTQDAAHNADKVAPATFDAVEAPHETDLVIVRLTPEAVERLGITTAPVEIQPMPRRRTFGGEVVIPAGNAFVVSAPVAGTVGEEAGVPLPIPGSSVAAGSAILRFTPLLSPERAVPTPAEEVAMANAQASLVSLQIVADGDVQRGEAEVEAAQIALDRAEQLLQDQVGSARDVDDARARLEVAQTTLDAARQRKETLDALSLDSSSNATAEPFTIVAPQSGIVRTFQVAEGQTVTAGTPLFEIVDLSHVWIRVPIYVGQQSEIVIDAEAHILGLEGDADVSGRVAASVAAPPSADPLAATADLFYELDNAGGEFRPGERVGVSLLLQGEAESLTIPNAAVLYDIYGGTWVYTELEDNRYQRARVVVDYTAGDIAVLSNGPEIGTAIVVDGAAELFGTEFGTGK